MAIGPATRIGLESTPLRRPPPATPPWYPLRNALTSLRMRPIPRSASRRGPLRQASLFLAVLVTAALGATATAAPPFAAGATVVVLTGLPGDVESETAFRDQARRLLQILAEGEGKPLAVHLLVDAPAGVQLPAGLEGDVRA